MLAIVVNKVVMVNPTVGGNDTITLKEVHPTWEEQFITCWKLPEGIGRAKLCRNSVGAILVSLVVASVM